MLAGVLLALICDAFRSIKKNLRLNTYIVFIFDLLFFFFASIVTFLMQFIYSNGQIRWYIILGELLGFLAERISVSPLFSKLLDIIFNAILFVFKPVFSFVHKTTLGFALFLEHIMKKAYKNVKNILKCTPVLLYNIIYYIKKRKLSKRPNSVKKQRRRENNGKKKKQLKRQKHSP